jgi:hypothetical protein
MQDELDDEKGFKFNAKTTEVYRKILEKHMYHFIHISKTQTSFDEEIIRKKMMIIDSQEERLKLRA